VTKLLQAWGYSQELTNIGRHFGSHEWNIAMRADLDCFICGPVSAWGSYNPNDSHFAIWAFGLENYRTDFFDGDTISHSADRGRLSLDWRKQMGSFASRSSVRPWSPPLAKAVNVSVVAALLAAKGWSLWIGS